MLDFTYEFEKECKAAGRGKKSVITTVINSEGRLVLANRFFHPLPPPQEVLQHLPNSSASVLVRLNHIVIFEINHPSAASISDPNAL